MSDVIEFRSEFAKRQPVHYSVHISHTIEGMSATTDGIRPSATGLLAVARDLERVAEMCRADAAEKSEAQENGAET